MTLKAKVKNEPENALLQSTQQQTLNDYLQGYLRGIRSGDIGALPIVFGMIVIAIIFQTANPNFLIPRNLVNLIGQMAAITAIGYGIVYVLLLGEIDLSVGFVSGTAAVSMTLALKGAVSGEMATGIGVFFALGSCYFVWHLLLAKLHNPLIEYTIPLRLLLGPLTLLVLVVAVLAIITRLTGENAEAVLSLMRWLIAPAVLLVVTVVTIRYRISVRAMLVFGLFVMFTLLVSQVLTQGATAWYIAVPIALIAAAGIGFLHGTIITYFGLPSFVVTLAGLLAWQGVVLIFIGGAGTVIVQDSVILGVANTYIQPPELSSLVAGLFVAAFAANELWQANTRRRLGLSAKPASLIVLQTALLGVLAGAAVYICNQDRGLPLIGVGLILLMIFLSFVATRTKFGRYVFAVGGNAEAARRAGINVQQIRVRVFMISSFMAGVGGVILASRLRSVDTNAGGGQVLLNSIAAAVIGGTSLFGGSGKVSSAILGAIIVASVDNGMGLIPNVSSGAKFIVTALVLLAAVVVDALARRSQKQSGIR